MLTTILSISIFALSFLQQAKQVIIQNIDDANIPLIEFPKEQNQPFIRKEPKGKYNKWLIPGNASYQFENPGKSYIAVLKDAFICPIKHGTTFDKDYQLLTVEGYDPVDEKFLTMPKLHFDKLASLVQWHSSSYYHWIVDTLPRLCLLLDLLRKDKEIKLLLHQTSPYYVYDYLKLAGIEESRCIKADVNFLYSADTVYFAHTPLDHRPSKQEVQRVRNIFVGQDNHTKPKKLIILLKRTGARINGTPMPRQILNFEELLKVMKLEFPQNKIVVFDGSLNAKETINLFSQAKLIVGAHGAGMANMIFSPIGTVALELIPEEGWHPRTIRSCVWTLACALDFSYWQIPLPEASVRKNFDIPTSNVIKVMKEII